jgi:3',5'-cyclic AMP phosphodiesterase CpdA
MRRVVQISDLHFGNNDPSLLTPLRDAIAAINPDVLVVSGDLVEHASKAEFRQARDFLETLPKPRIIVPGNHDLAFYNLAQRALVGLATYKKFITADTAPEYRDDEIAIIGANTSRIWPIRGGSLSSLQLARLEAQFSALPENLMRILVTHHPFDLPEDQQSRLIVGHARRSIAGLAPFVDVLLAGHIHLSSSGSTAARYKTQGHALAFVQAGTCVSNRNKGENNSFNSLRIGTGSNGEKATVVERFSWDKRLQSFTRQDSIEYQLGKAGWARCEANKEAEVLAAGPTEAL